MKEQYHAEIEKLLEYSERDLSMAVHVYGTTNTNFLRHVCCACHQSAINSFSAFLVFRGVKLTNELSLKELKEMCEKSDNDFSVISELSSNLFRYTLDSNYPGVIEVTEQETQVAIVAASVVREFVKSKVIKETT